LAAISLATVPVTSMTLVNFNFKLANSSKSYEIHKTRIRRFAFTLLYVETRGNSRPARYVFCGQQRRMGVGKG
jgi:hypothetical protein